MADYDVALTIYDKMPADITEISAEEAEQINVLGLGDGVLNEWNKEDAA